MSKVTVFTSPSLKFIVDLIFFLVYLIKTSPIYNFLGLTTVFFDFLDLKTGFLELNNFLDLKELL